MKIPSKKRFLNWNLLLKGSIWIAGVTFLLTAGLPSCNNSSQNSESAQKRVNDSIRTADSIADSQYLKDMDTFRKQIGDSIKANDTAIAKFKVKIEHGKNKIKADYKKEVAVLEQKNKELQKKLDEYKAEGKEKWEVFKADFTRDMDTLGRDIKKLTAGKDK